ncbi:hypothetical protein JTB14_008485 [Gonioctena quinquepunctata]|nr:hypothetical protein JTB14_008485 [Gonioctena quinquepunctata]
MFAFHLGLITELAVAPPASEYLSPDGEVGHVQLLVAGSRSRDSLALAVASKQITLVAHQRMYSNNRCVSSNTDTESMPEQEASQVVETSEVSHHIQSASTTPISSTKRPFSRMVPPQWANVLKRLPSNKRQPTRFESAKIKLQQIAELTTADTEDQSMINLENISHPRLDSSNVDNSTPLSQTVSNYDVDDIWYSNSTSTNEFDEESSGLRSLLEWFSQNSSYSNSDKTSYLRFHTPQNKQDLDLTIQVGGESKPSFVKHVYMFLGLLLSTIEKVLEMLPTLPCGEAFP